MVRAWVNDSGGEAVRSVLGILVDPALEVTLQVSNSTPLLGQTVALSATVSGGTIPYTYTYLGLPPGCVSADAPEIGCLPTQAGLYNISLLVTDGNAVSANASTNLSLAFDFIVDAPSQDQVNHPLIITVKPDDGSGTLTFSYDGLPPGCASVNSSQVTCTPNQVGDYVVSISVNDQYGDHATHQVRVEVVNGGPQSTLTFLELPIVLVGALAIAVVVAMVAVGYGYQRRGRVERRSDLYSTYRMSPDKGAPLLPPLDAAVLPLEPQEAEPESAGHEMQENDDLSDLV